MTTDPRAAAVSAPLVPRVDRPTEDMFRVLGTAPESGPRITPLLRHQLEIAWAQDERRRARFAMVRTGDDVKELQRELRATALGMVGGLPTERTPLDAIVTGVVACDGFRIEKVIFQSIPGLHVTASLYLPDGAGAPLPAVLLACGHSPLGKAYPTYQTVAVRLVRRGYVVLVWDPVGQGERSQCWDRERGRSRYNLSCGEHAVLGNLATIAGASLLRWELWDGIRALDYLVSRPETDTARIAITGSSGGGLQAAWMGALDERIGLIAPSCFITSLPMRMAARIFDDPESDPEQDPCGFVAQGLDHAGLLLLAYPRPVNVIAAVRDFIPIEGARSTFREVARIYRMLGHADRFAMTEGHHPHAYSDENQAAFLAFLDRWTGQPGTEHLIPVTPLDPETLSCTASGQVRVDLPGRSLQELIRDHWHERRDGTSVALGDLYRDGDETGPRDWPIVPFDGAPARERITWRHVGSAACGSARIDRYVLRHDTDLVLPLLHIHDATQRVPGRTVLRLGLSGRVGLMDWDDVLADLRRGDDVVSFDPRGLGETRLRYVAATNGGEVLHLDGLYGDHEEAVYANPISGVLENHVYNALLIGRPYLLDLVADAEMAVRFARERLGAGRVAAVGEGDARLLARAIASAVSGVDWSPGATIVGAFSWVSAVEEMRERWPVHYIVPDGVRLHLADDGPV